VSLKDDPYFTDYPAYQMGMIQDRFLALQFVLSQIWKYKTRKNQKAFRKLLYNKQVRNVARYLPAKTVFSLKKVGQIRNIWNKKMGLDEDKLWNIILQLDYLRLPSSKPNRKRLYQLSFDAINLLHINLDNIEPMRSFWKELFKNAK